MATGESGNHWHLRAPRFLVVPHLDVTHALYMIDELLRAFHRLRWLDSIETKGEPQQVFGLRFPSEKESVPRNFARALVDLRDATVTAEATFSGVEEEFGAIADGNAQCQVHYAASENPTTVFQGSWHHAGLSYTKGVLNSMVKGLDYVAGDISRIEWEHVFSWHRLENLTTEDVLGVLVEHQHYYCKFLREENLSSIESVQLDNRLRQEMFRAWKRRFPDDSEPYETLSVDSPEAKRASEDWERVRSYTWAPEDGWGFVPGKYSLKGNVFPLSGIDWLLLKAFVHSERPLTMDELQAKGWPEDSYKVEESTVRKHLSDLRSKLRENHGLAKKFDPIPHVDRGNLRAWEIHPDLR